MSAPAATDELFDDALIKFDSFTRPRPSIDGNIPNVDHTLSRLPNNASSRIEFKATQPKELMGTQNLQSGKFSDETSLSDIHLKILQTKLALKAERETEQRKLAGIKSHDRPSYYQLPSSGVKDFYKEIKDFLPPNVSLGGQKSTANFLPQLHRNRLSARDNSPSKLSTINFEDDEVDLDDYTSASPTGHWENPIVKQALSRQVDLEHYTKLLLRNVLYLIILLLFKSLIKKVIILYEINLKAQPLYKQMMYNSRFDFETLVNSVYFIIAEQIVTCWPLINIVISVAKLLKGQDQCWDLPLTNKQRTLIGLKVNDNEEENEANLILTQRKYDINHHLANDSVPKYNPMNDYLLGDAGKRTSDQYTNGRWVYK
ncbi:hypothetical protein KGF57_001919 [Candida theae]|uniref:Uncharacterized protein n=1 Tax=Candida theae TaxID=1198502 RepID=A0AAD5BG17_9ASCO|nr:uncharacterized protein KGF57_001919 [Candida theae]KAI5960523.1 hypothetical protein KGF57_001919 [Candida theae]